MKFLNESKDENDEEKGEELVVLKKFSLKMDCLFCDKWGQMEGGYVGDGKAKLICPHCNRINEIKWGIDL